MKKTSLLTMALASALMTSQAYASLYIHQDKNLDLQAQPPHKGQLTQGQDHKQQGPAENVSIITKSAIPLPPTPAAQSSAQAQDKVAQNKNKERNITPSGPQEQKGAKSSTLTEKRGSISIHEGIVYKGNRAPQVGKLGKTPSPIEKISVEMTEGRLSHRLSSILEDRDWRLIWKSGTDYEISVPYTVNYTDEIDLINQLSQLYGLNAGIFKKNSTVVIHDQGVNITGVKQ